MYKEHYELRKVRNPEDLGKPGKPYCVTHYIPKDGGTWIACGGSKYFETQAEAEAFFAIQRPGSQELVAAGPFALMEQVFRIGNVVFGTGHDIFSLFAKESGIIIFC